MNFFTCYVQEEGISVALEDFVFSPKANLGTNESTKAQLPFDKRPHMLSRLLTGVLHPMVHIGYGAEFNLPGMIVEGKAHQTKYLHERLTSLVTVSSRSRPYSCSPCSPRSSWSIRDFRGKTVVIISQYPLTVVVP